MAQTTIKIDLNKDLGVQLKEIEKVQEWINKKTERLLEKLKNIGLEQAQLNFSLATYNMLSDGTVQGVQDIEVYADKTKNGYSIIAAGNEVCFIEFGAGVSYSGTYPIERPSGIANIGEYGKGRGKQSRWAFKDGNEVKWTFGTPTNASMYQASKSIEHNILEIAREVFR